jgi:hypothetical protein
MQAWLDGWSAESGWSEGQHADRQPTLLLVFGGVESFSDPAALAALRSRYPTATLLGCSTAGEISDTQVHDGTLVAAAVEFDHTTVVSAHRRLTSADASHAVGLELAAALPPEGLVHVIVLATGLQVNGSELVQGLSSGLPPGVAATGGLAADGPRFQRTWVALNEVVADDIVAVVGLYGSRLRVGYGSMGGWDPFGPERLITRSVGNVLYELDGESALGLYKRYLGEHASELPASGLRFPLSIYDADSDHPVVRTILSVDEADGSLVFAGDVPQGHHARLMTANVDRLVDGASGAATNSHDVVGSDRSDLALLISCVGRRLVLGQRVEEEVESVRAVLGDTTTLCGYYSYGEIAPFRTSTRCELHNQTMTITTFAER